MNRISLCIKLAALAIVATISCAAPAQDKQIDLKLSTWIPPKHPLSPALQAWAEDVKKESKGSIVSTIFTTEQLGKAFDHYDMTRDGIADVAYVAPG